MMNYTHQPTEDREMKELSPQLDAQIKSLGAEVKRIRQSRNLSQAELASRVGVRQPMISRIEKGTHVPTWRNLDRVFDALNAEISFSVSASN